LKIKKFNNYVIVLVIYLITVALVFYCAVLYKKSSDLVDSNCLINAVVMDISEDNYHDIYSNINNYIVENSSFVLYISNCRNESVSFDNELKNYIIENDLVDAFLYVNVDEIKKMSDLNDIFKDFADFDVLYNISKKTIPVFIYFKDGKVNTVIDSSDYDFNVIKNKFIDLGVMEW